MMGCGDNEFHEGLHVDLPIVKSAGGPVLESPSLAVVTFSNDPLAKDIDTYASWLARSTYWKRIVGEYGVGQATVTPITETEMPPATIDDLGIQSYLAAHLDPAAANWPSPTRNTLYVLYYPAATTVSGLCGALTGYHSSFTLNDGMMIAYAVIPRCTNYPVDQLDELTEISSHELVEAATDPYIHTAPAFDSASDFAWQQNGGGEIADMCEYAPGALMSDPQSGYLVERAWSNVESLAGHDPCVPHPDGDVYFQAAPSEFDNVTLSFLNGDPAVTTRGLHIPVGSTRNIMVQLFSDAPTPVITLWAFEWPLGASPNEASALSFSWDSREGMNNDSVGLSITVNSDKYGEGHEYFIIVSQVGNLQNEWPVVVAN